jgi:hypothetical protein
MREFWLPRLQFLLTCLVRTFLLGILLYAIAPDSLFHLNDVEAAKVCPIPAEGCFKSHLLEGTDQPAGRQESTWNDLPTTA